MCGIIGYIGRQQAQPILMDGLKKLEYRGYDSAGIAVYVNGGVNVRKCGGRLNRLEALLAKAPLKGTAGIGHTRWATHGAPTDQNAHPQMDETKRIAVVHNGVLENDTSLRTRLWKEGVRFVSETDTEIIAHLIGGLYQGNMLETLFSVLPSLKGSYALCVLCADEPEKLFCVRQGSPLIIAKTNDGAFAASDIPALISHTQTMSALKDGQIAVLTKDDIRVYDRQRQEISLDSFTVDFSGEAAEKGGYPHFMLKEIMEQPRAMERTLHAYLSSPPALKKPSRVTLLGCGTAYHAALLGVHYLRSIAHIEADAYQASEFDETARRYADDELCIAVSQSGETADTLSALQRIKPHMPTLALTNTKGSTLSRVCDETLLTQAGMEIAVASTKAYVTQALSLLLLARQFASVKDDALNALPDYLTETLRLSPLLQRFADQTLNSRLFLFIGRGADRLTAMEAALKCKEVSYLPCEAYPAGELKHGAIALIEPGTPVVALCTQEDSFEKTLVNLREAAARGAKTVCVCPRAYLEKARHEAQVIFALPDAPQQLLPILSALPMQLMAYHMAVSRGLDVDKPRNLAKSVTVQ